VVGADSDDEVATAVAMDGVALPRVLAVVVLVPMLLLPLTVLLAAPISIRVPLYEKSPSKWRREGAGRDHPDHE
jgi:hypothetical protein